MSVELINPDGLFKPDSYSQVAIGTGSRLVFVSGQIAQDSSGNLVGSGDLAAQSEQVYLNLASALDGIGASFDDVVKTNVYVVGWTPDKMGELVSGAMRVAQRVGFDPRRAMTMVGVEALSEPEYLIEVEAIAVVE